MTLSFNPAHISRTMTREDWRECYRWLRKCNRCLAQLQREASPALYEAGYNLLASVAPRMESR